MEQFRYALVAVIWLAGGIALVTGYFYSPNYRVSRIDNPQAYWAGMVTSAVVGIIATILMIRG